MIPTNLLPGTEVICRDAKPRHFTCCLREGAVYTIRDYYVAHTGYVGVRLNEVRADQDGWSYHSSGERGWYRDRFDLLVAPKIFEEMLKRATSPRPREEVSELMAEAIRRMAEKMD